MSRTQYEILALALRYFFILLAAYICVRAVLSLKRPLSRWRQFKSVLLLVLLTVSAFALLSYRQGGSMDIQVMLTGAAAAAALIAQFLLVWILFRHAELDLLIVADALLVLGIVMLERLTPDMAMRQVQWLGAGSILLGAGIMAGRYLKPQKGWMWIGIAFCLALLLLPFLFGEEIRGARNWVTIAGGGFQPSEFVKVGLVLILAGIFELVRAVYPIPARGALRRTLRNHGGIPKRPGGSPHLFRHLFIHALRRHRGIGSSPPGPWGQPAWGPSGGISCIRPRPGPGTGLAQSLRHRGGVQCRVSDRPVPDRHRQRRTLRGRPGAGQSRGPCLRRTRTSYSPPSARKWGS